MKMNVVDQEYRYQLDFIIIPVLIRRAGAEAIDLILRGSYNAMCSLYNNAWPGGRTKRFAPNDFRCRCIREGMEMMLYITLPSIDPRAPMASTHMAITCHRTMGGYSDIRVFNVERSSAGTTAIGEMHFTEDGRWDAHFNYGEAAESDGKNIHKIWELAFDTADA